MQTLKNIIQIYFGDKGTIHWSLYSLRPRSCPETYKGKPSSLACSQAVHFTVSDRKYFRTPQVLRQFGELPVDLVDIQKYAAWKAAEISKALREGRQPTSGGAQMTPFAEDLSQGTERESSPEREIDFPAVPGSPGAKDNQELPTTRAGVHHGPYPYLGSSRFRTRRAQKSVIICYVSPRR